MSRTAVMCSLIAMVISSASAVAQGVPFPGKFGLGLTLIEPDSVGSIVVARCSAAGPARAAGLAPGDTLISLDGRSISGWHLRAVLDYLLQDEPGPVSVTIRRGSQELSFEIVRMRMSEIAAKEGHRWEPVADSSNYLRVPLHEPDPLKPGDLVPVAHLGDRGCSPTSVALTGGNPTLIYFWASWCGPCKQFMRSLKAGAVDSIAPDARLIGINVDEECATFVAVIDSLGPPGDQYWEGREGALALGFGAHRRGIPSAVLIRDGGEMFGFATGMGNILAMVKNYARVLEIQSKK